MKRRMALAVLLVIFTNTNSVIAGNEILLKSRQFIPAKGITAATKARIEATPKRAHVLIQLDKIPTTQERRELEAKGIKLLSYIPNKAWFASIPSDKAVEIATLSSVRAIIEILPEDKIDHSIKEKGVNNYSTNEKGEAKLVVLFFNDISLNDTSVVVSNYDGTVIGAAPLINALVIFLPKDLIYELASHDSVWLIDQNYEASDLNDGTRASIGANAVQESPYNLDGTGVIVGQWETYHPDGTHSDIAGRITNINDGYGISSHATHVAGTLLGNGSRSAAEGGTPLQWMGIATNATISSYHYWSDVVDLYSDYNDAINTYDIDLSTNSWAFLDWDCEYDIYTQAEDNIVIGACNKGILIMQAAGNEGGDDGWMSLRSNAVAKNVVTIGATNSNDDSLAYFSSLGPTADGRIKPDIVAPGCQVGGDGGTKSTVPGNTYGVKCGTSMATPAVSGSVALMLEDWRDNHSSQTDPLPSTIKAILIQTAVDLGNTGPDYSYGYGKINVKDAIDLIREDVNNNVIVEDSIIDQDNEDRFTITVPEGQSELKITLVWDDYPGDPAAEKALVNDLDLIVKNPNGVRHYPWILNPLSPAAPATQGEDHTNNVEQVYVDNPTSGIWLIEIAGNIVPEPAQSYSLVSNNFSLTSIEEANMLSKFDDVNDSVVPDDYITYTIDFANPVTYPFDPNYLGDINDVVIVDHLPDEVYYMSASGPNSTYDILTNTVTWNIGMLSPGESNSVTLTVQVNELAEPLGTISNLCVLAADEVGTITAEEVTDVNSWNPSVIYVDANAVGSNTGMSWKDAYRELYDALERAGAGCGNQIWVAEGTYRPLYTGDDFNDTFQLADGVALYGGFAGKETALNQRNWITNETILDGDLGEYKTWFLLWADGVNEATVDGFTIKNGFQKNINIDNSSLTLSNNIIKESEYAGIYCARSEVNITNCNIEQNNFYGIVCSHYLSEVNITNCIIQDNGADGIECIYSGDVVVHNCIINNNNGFGIYNEQSPMDITNNRINANNGGGVYSYTDSAGVKIKNNYIYGNNVYGYGIYIQRAPDVPRVISRNNTIVNNSGFGIRMLLGTVVISNCIVWGNNNTGAELYNCTTTYSCVENGNTINGNINDDPCFIDPDANDFHLGPNSPCIDSGDPNPNYSGETDIDGEDRKIDGDFNGTAIVDMGADEYYWSPADFNEDGYVNFIDYAILAPTWLTSSGQPNYNPNCDLEDDNEINYYDLALFCDDWLWIAGWNLEESMMLGQGTGSGFEQSAYSVSLFEQAEQLEQQPVEVGPADIERMLEFLEEIWLSESELRETIDEQDWNKFIESLKDYQ